MKTLDYKRTIIDMRNHLVNQYDYIGKLDAMKYLRKLYPHADLKMFIEAYQLAY